jgi:hypothetical protein
MEMKMQEMCQAILLLPWQAKCLPSNQLSRKSDSPAMLISMQNAMMNEQNAVQSARLQARYFKDLSGQYLPLAGSCGHSAARNLASCNARQETWKRGSRIQEPLSV